MEYYISRFNIYLENNGEHYVFNTIDTCILCISDSLHKYLNSHTTINSDILDEDLIQLLLKHEIILTNEQEQLDRLEYLFQTEGIPTPFLVSHFRQQCIAILIVIIASNRRKGKSYLKIILRPLNHLFLSKPLNANISE